MAEYAIGDLQGSIKPLQALLEKIRFQPGSDRLWFTGDLVNRGPDSLACLRLVRALGASAQVVLGNHDLHLLCVASGATQPRKGDTLNDILEASDRVSLLEWLRHRPLLIRDAAHVMVHAGLLPQWSLDDAERCATEVAAALAGPAHVEFLSQLYGDEPAQWRDDLGGIERLRLIVNAMTRMRVCDAEGRLLLRFKGSPEDTPLGAIPWFDVPARRHGGAAIICGHWSALGLRLRQDLIAVDTGCLWGRTLSAVRLHDRTVFQVRGEMAPDFGAGGHVED